VSPSSSNLAENLSRTDIDVMPPWKQELNERLAATRTRRQRREEQIALPGLEQVQRKVDSRTASLVAKVAQRYANAPSYSELLATGAAPKAETAVANPPDNSVQNAAPESSTEIWTSTLSTIDEDHFAEPEILEREPALAAIEPLDVNLIEYPRELVAARKIRPRLAEGPLRDAPSDGADQLKIFEVAPESVCKTISIGKTPVDWIPIRLDSHPADAERAEESTVAQIPLQAASLEDRIMAGIFDLALIVAAFSVFVLVFVACTTHPPTGKPALLSAGLVLAGFCVLYQYLFFKFANGTPGMRYAKIALCTFDDENPTRQAMCRRVPFVMLSAAPLGLGFAWACFDPDRLSWHDRLSRMYQRSYS